MFKPVYIFPLIGNGYFAYYKPKSIKEWTGLITSKQKTRTKYGWFDRTYTMHPRQCLTFWISMYSVQTTQIGHFYVCVYPGIPTGDRWNPFECTSVFAQSGQQTSSSTEWREYNVDIDIGRGPTSFFSGKNYMETFPHYRVLYLLLCTFVKMSVMSPPPPPPPLKKNQSS